jgi:hypothetical protein
VVDPKKAEQPKQREADYPPAEPEQHIASVEPHFVARFL